jgi:hypothetical protein
VFTRAVHWSLSWARSIQSTPSHPISLRSILILSTHLHLNIHEIHTQYSQYGPVSDRNSASLGLQISLLKQLLASACSSLIDLGQ